MRFFSGTRDPGKKKMSAGDMFKQKLLGNNGPALTKEEQYKKMLDDKIAKIMIEAGQGNKKGFKLPGTKESDAPAAKSKNYMAMIETLARQKLQKEMKQQKKKQMEIERVQKKEKQAEELKKQGSNSGGSIFFDFTDSVFKDNT